MNTQQLQNEKLNIINWITQIQDYSLVEKIKNLMNSSNPPYILTDEQQKILDSQLNSDKSQYIEAATLYTSLKSKYKL